VECLRAPPCGQGRRHDQLGRAAQVCHRGQVAQLAKEAGQAAPPRRGRVGRHVQAAALGPVAVAVVGDPVAVVGDPVAVVGDPAEGGPVAATGARMGSAVGGADPALVVPAVRGWPRRRNRPGRSRFRRR
jgi:hypothetical protein